MAYTYDVQYSPIVISYQDLSIPQLSFQTIQIDTVQVDQVDQVDQDKDAVADPVPDCQDYWYATPEGNCMPEVGLVKTSCGGNTMSIKFDKKVLRDGQDIDAAYVGDDKADNNCMPSLSEDGYELTFGLDDCGTILSYDEENKLLKYTVSPKPSSWLPLPDRITVRSMAQYNFMI